MITTPTLQRLLRLKSVSTCQLLAVCLAHSKPSSNVMYYYCPLNYIFYSMCKFCPDVGFKNTNLFTCSWCIRGQFEHNMELTFAQGQLHLWEMKAMAPHSSTLAWKIPWMGEPGRLQSMGSLSQTRLSDFTFTFHFHALEQEMATHSSVLAWRIPGTGEPSRLPSMGSHRVRHSWSDLAAAAGVWWDDRVGARP